MYLDVAIKMMLSTFKTPRILGTVHLNRMDDVLFLPTGD